MIYRPTCIESGSWPQLTFHCMKLILVDPTVIVGKTGRVASRVCPFVLKYFVVLCGTIIVLDTPLHLVPPIASLLVFDRERRELLIILQVEV